MVEKGVKYDSDKPRIGLHFMQYFPKAIQAVTEVSDFGAEKYRTGGWKYVLDGKQRYTDAMDRHRLAENFSMTDEESGLLHAAHLAWCALARLEFILGVNTGDEDYKLEVQPSIGEPRDDT